MFRPLQTIIIDRPFKLEGDEMYAIALTYEDDSYSLWVLDMLPEEIDNSKIVVEPWNQTNRDLMHRNSVSGLRSIESIEIGKFIFYFDGAIADSLNLFGSQEINKLHYFIEKGVPLYQWDNFELSRMRLIKYRSSKPTPMIDLKVKDEKIKLNFRAYLKKVKVLHNYSAAFNLEEPVKFEYYNPFEQKEETFYVHKFETYDLQNYIDSLENNEKYTKASEEQLREGRGLMVDFFKKMKSRNTSIVLMTYEADYGLEFLSREFLDRKIEMSSSASSIGFIFKPDEKTGDFGKRLFIASFLDIPNDQLDQIEFELHYISKNIKEVQLII